MSLPAGTRLGSYEILVPLGAGGMGEVYRARDSRLAREVAIKVLPAQLAEDPEALARFEREAKAIAALSHPNILAIHDFGTQDRIAYAVMELLRGETLGSRLRQGRPPARKAVEYAAQIARGLAAAHEKGIVHRDLKPENLFLTEAGHVKILDFGLAKLARPESSSDAETKTAESPPPTQPGTVMGTVGYMSPEQVRGESPDHRSDIFSLGVVLYELLSGRRAFKKDTAVGTLNAILEEEPPEISEIARDCPAALERIVRCCLEKRPSERFQSARDLGFMLESLWAPAGATAVPTAEAAVSSRRRARPFVLGLVALLLLSHAGLFLIGKRAGDRPVPSFRRLTFSRGDVSTARFAPDGETVVYTGRSDGKTSEVFWTRMGSLGSQAVDLPKGSALASVSSAGELAVWFEGALAHMAMTGGVPRKLLEGVESADWSPDGTQLAVVVERAGRQRVEFPVGKVLYEPQGGVRDLRISPEGDRLAFFETTPDAPASVAVVDLAGKKKALSSGWARRGGLAWSPDGREVWFTASRGEHPADLRAVTLGGAERVVARLPGQLGLRDISRDGRVLLTIGSRRTSIVGLAPGEGAERDLSWLDSSVARSLSADGTTLLFTEEDIQRQDPWVYLRKTDGSPALRLGQGSALALSHDGKWALTIVGRPGREPGQLALLPTGAGELKLLKHEGLTPALFWHGGSAWFPDGARVLFTAEGRGLRYGCSYVMPIEGGAPRAVTPDQVFATAVSPDGRLLAGHDGKLYPVDGGDPRPIPGFAEGDVPIRWSADGRFFYTFHRGEGRSEVLPAPVHRVDLSNGRRELIRELAPADRAGVPRIENVLLTPDGRHYVYTYASYLSDLYLAEGLK